MAVNPQVTTREVLALRTPYASYSYIVRSVDSSGALFYLNACSGNRGMRPLCNLNSSILVSDNVNSRGNYEIIWNRPPTTPSGISVPASAYSKRDISVSWGASSGPDGDTVSVVEAVDGGTIKTHSPALGAQNTMSVAGTNFIKLKNEQHNLTVAAADSTGGTATRTMSFTKQVHGFTIKLDPPLSATTTPERITINATREVAAGALFAVEVCNNANDATPTWEDSTPAVLAGLAHAFTNEVKTSTKWGVNIRAKIERNGAVGDCWISGVWGNIE